MRISILLITLLLSSICQAQWKTGSDKNKFDGNYLFAQKSGKGGEFPFTKPNLIVTRFNSDEPNISISEVGYTGCNGTLSFAFNGSDEVYLFSTLTNSDKDAVFVSGTLSEISTLVNLFKEKATVYVRYDTSCGLNDYEFSLAGSSSAINFVVGEYYENKKKTIIDELELNMVTKKSLDSVNKIKIREETKQRRILDSISVFKTNIELDESSQKIKEGLLNDFKFEEIDSTEAPLKRLFTIKVKSMIKLNYVKQLFSSGAVVRNDIEKIFPSDNYIICNRFEEGCIRVDAVNKKNETTYKLFISRSELSKLSDDDYRIRILTNSWMELMKVANQ
jgi:hypothetical protein